MIYRNFFASPDSLASPLIALSHPSAGAMIASLVLINIEIVARYLNGDNKRIDSSEIHFLINCYGTSQKLANIKMKKGGNK